MKRTLLAILAIGAATFFAPAGAHAAEPYAIDGGCGYMSTSGDVINYYGPQTGLITDLSMTRSRGISPLPVDATVSCWIEIDGVEAPHTRYSYSGVGIQAGVDRVSFYVPEGQFWWECESVTYADGTTQAMPCPTPIPPAGLPPAVIDALNDLFDFADPLVCPHLADLAGSYGPVTIEPDGDVDLADPLELGLNPAYDCPPYRSI